MARRTKEDAEKTKESLLNAAESLFLRQGVAATTLEQIAREANVTRGAVYWHFENKTALFNAMFVRVRSPIEDMYAELFSPANEDLVEGMRHMCLAIFKTLAKDSHMRDVFTIILLRCEQLDCSTDGYAKLLSARRQQALTRYGKVFGWAEKNKLLAKGVTPEFAALSLHTFLTGVFIEYLRDPKNYKLATLAQPLVDGFFRGILKA